MAEAALQTRYARVQQILTEAAGRSTVDYGGIGRFWELPLADLLQASLHGVRLIAPASYTAAAAATPVSGPAPARAASAHACCGNHSSAQDPQGDAPEDRRPRYPGRAAASGLIQGLRGQAPFDGSRFPPLLWGGARVAPDDIQFIAEWIDDGCPADDHEIASFTLSAAAPVVPVAGAAAAASPTGVVLHSVRADNVEAIVRDTHDPYGVYSGSANEYKYQSGEIKQRMNIDCLPEVALDKLRYAFREMYALNKWPEDRRSYNNVALIHQNHCQHGWERFLPWHRIYLYEFEQALQDVCPDVTMPYWDWTMPQYRPECPEKGWLIPMALQAFLTDASIAWLEHAQPALPADAAATLRQNMLGVRYASQHRFFAAVADLIGVGYTQGEYRRRLLDALLASNSLWYPLRYPAEYTQNGKPSTITKTIHYHYPTAEDVAEILSLRTFRDFGGGSLYNDSFGFIDQNPHNTMHIWTGGMNPDYQDPSAPAADFAQDLKSDRNRGVHVAGRRFHAREDLYTQPQFGDMFSNLTASYDPVFWPVHANVDRLWHEWQQVHPNGEPADLDSVLTPWSYTIRDTLDMSQFGYEYVKSTYLLPVGLDAPVGRFVSKPIDVPGPVRTSFRSAEVRLHRVPQLVRSCFVRVFLNLPDANAATPIDDSHYAGYLAIFGHGPCYGGPGHCATPPNQPRKFDLRPRSHNTPRNHRINVTKAVRRLLDAGVSSLQLTLVVIGVDYCEDHDLLRLDGVSLNFLD
jgi:tyrosinase